MDPTTTLTMEPTSTTASWRFPRTTGNNRTKVCSLVLVATIVVVGALALFWSRWTWQAGGSTPIGPHTAAGSLESGIYHHLFFPSGISLVFWDDVTDGGSFSNGYGDTGDAAYHSDGGASRQDGSIIIWEYSVDTIDGMPGPSIYINGEAHDISGGGSFFFLIRTSGAQQGDVQQLEREPSAICQEWPCNYTDYAQATESDADLVAFYGENGK